MKKYFKLSALLILVVVFKYSFSQSVNEKNSIVYLEIIIDTLENDFLSKDYYAKGEKSILYQSLELVKDFYSKIGQEYGLPCVDIRIKTKSDTNITAKIIRFRYTTLKKDFEETTSLPGFVKGYVSAKYGRYVPPEKEKDHEFCKMVKKWYWEDIKNKAGSSNSYLKETILFSDKRFNKTGKKKRQYVYRVPLTNYLSHVVSHELAHVFGLDHVRQKLKNNLMVPMVTTKAAKEMKLSKEQVQKILLHFGVI